MTYLTSLNLSVLICDTVGLNHSDVREVRVPFVLLNVRVALLGGSVCVAELDMLAFFWHLVLRLHYPYEGDTTRLLYGLNGFMVFILRTVCSVLQAVSVVTKV